MVKDCKEYICDLCKKSVTLESTKISLLSKDDLPLKELILPFQFTTKLFQTNEPEMTTHKIEVCDECLKSIYNNLSIHYMLKCDVNYGTLIDYRTKNNKVDT